MKIIMFEQASPYEKRAIVEGIRIIRDKFTDNAYPKLDEHFESEFNCTILYGRNTGIIGFTWQHEADYSWFLLKCS